ncbi:MAG: pyrroline-5-carboxylate reductase [Methyloligellaceae bacterium]
MTIKLAGPLLLVGAGKMGGALLAGWLERGLDPTCVFVQDPEPPTEALALVQAHGIACDAAPKPPDAPCVVVLAVKPQIMDIVLPTVASLVGPDTVVLSIAAGRTIASLQAHLGEGTAIVRSMPNTPAAIGRGITVAHSNSAVTPNQAERCIALLSAVGEVAWVDDEALLDPVTAVSGSGPAYVFLLTECLAEAGVEAGLDEDLARRLARATVSGAAELMRQSETEPATLRQNVTSPGGTTAAALQVLMDEAGLQQLMTRAVAAAAERSRDLSA